MVQAVVAFSLFSFIVRNLSSGKNLVKNTVDWEQTGECGFNLPLIDKIPKLQMTSGYLKILLCQ
jgi:hypothetical protein